MKNQHQQPSAEETETARACAAAVGSDFDRLSDDPYAGHLSKNYWLLIARAAIAQATASPHRKDERQ